MAFDIFLKIDGIKGESSDAQHREEIEPASFSWGVSQQGSTSVGGGAGAGKASFQDLHVVMNVSRASPQLFLACAEGRHIKTAVLTCRKAGGRDQRDFMPSGTPLAVMSRSTGESLRLQLRASGPISSRC